MKEAKNLVEFLDGIGKAQLAVEITSKAKEPFAQAVKESDLETNNLAVLEVRGGKTIVSTDDPSTLAQLLAIAENCGITGVAIVPRITPDLVLASHRQGEVKYLKNQFDKGDLTIVRTNSESLVAEFVLDAGCRTAARTIAIECAMIDGKAKPVTYCLNQYVWNGRGLSLEKSETSGSKTEISELMVCGWKNTEEVVASITDEQKKVQAADDISQKIKKTVGRLAFLTGLALSETHRHFVPRRREHDGPLGHRAFADLVKR